MLALIVVLQFLTAPVGAHMVGRAAYREGDLLDEDTVLDELAPRYPELAAPGPEPSGGGPGAGPGPGS